jgi:hypothetical protein
MVNGRLRSIEFTPAQVKQVNRPNLESKPNLHNGRLSS